MKELNILSRNSRTEVGSNLYLGDSEDESDAKIFMSLTLKLACNQLHTSISNWCQGSHSKLKGTMIRVLVEKKIILTVTTSVTRRLKFKCKCKCKFNASAKFKCKCTIITLLDHSNLNAFRTFWPALNILRLVDDPKIIEDCNFRSADARVSLSNFSFNKFYERFACHVTSHLLLSLPHQLPVVFVKLKIYKNEI